jgi:hypothetical protein
MRRWRSHPIRFAAIIGALFGLTDVIVIEVMGLSHKSSSSVLSLLWPTSAIGSSFSESKVAQTFLIFVIEVAANVLVWALLFAARVALVVVIRLAFIGMRNRPRS